MKATCWLLLSFCSLVSGRNFCPRKAIVIQKSIPRSEWHETNHHKKVLTNIPRGGGTVLGLSPDLSTKLFLFHQLIYTRSFIDPNGMYRTLMKRNFDNDYLVFALQTGTLAALCVAVMTYVAVYGTGDFIDIIKLGNVGCATYFLIQLITGSYKKSGVASYAIQVMAIIPTLLQLALWFKVGDTKLFAMMFLVPALIQGLTGYFAPTLNARLWGADISKSNTSQLFQKWLSWQVGLTTLIPAVVLYTGSWQKAIACALHTAILFVIDIVFVSKLAEKSGITVAPLIMFVALCGLMSYTLA